MMEDNFELFVAVQSDDATPERIQDDLVQQLYAALRDLRVQGIRPAHGDEIPEGARAIEFAVVSAFLVKVGPDAVKAVVRGIREWLNRSSARRVELQVGDNRLTLEKASPEQQEVLMNAWLRAIKAGSE